MVLVVAAAVVVVPLVVVLVGVVQVVVGKSRVPPFTAFHIVQC